MSVDEFPKLQGGNEILCKLVNGWQANTIWLYNSGQPYNDYDLYNIQSPQANYGTSTLPGDPNTYFSYSDYKESAAFGSSVDFARPILSNKNAPVGTIGI